MFSNSQLKKSVYSILTLSFFITFNIFAANPPASQTAGGILQQEKMMQKSQKLEKAIKTPKKIGKETMPEEIKEENVGPKVLIKEIKVEGATLIPEKRIKAITSKYQGKELSLKEMQKVADLITDEYRKKGYMTSRAYIPPQTIKNGVLTIRVVEGKLGELKIEGNKYFKTSLLEKKISLKKGEPFDFSELQKSLTYINEHPDRTAKVILAPGKKPGTTDVILKVKDNLPFHIGFEYDNFASRFLEKDRYALTLAYNNLLGFDDMVYLKLQRSEYGLYRMQSVRYTIPINRSLEIGFYGLHDKTKLGGEYKDLDSRGETNVYGVFLTESLIVKPNFNLKFNLGFDYKNIKDYLLGILDSYDKLRVIKTGFDLDTTDKWGRTIFTAELDSGIPDIMGGMRFKDSNASRSGAGGRFYKGVFNLFRLQPGPFSSYILWKNQAQFSNYNLCASEQFEIGGPYSVRGYPTGEFSGDKGYYTAFEWSFPAYFMPKRLKVPFTNDTFYNAFHTVLFYDWATTHLNKPVSGERKHRTLKSAGFGFRLNLSNNFSARIEFGYPLGKHSSDGHNLQRWVEVIKRF